MFDKQKISFSRYTVSRIFVMALVVSFFVGGAAGGVIGFFASDFAADYIGPWVRESLASLKTSPSESKLVLASKGDEAATTESVAAVSPAVVSIVISKDVSKMYNATGPDIFGFNNEFFQQFGIPFEITPAPTPKSDTGKNQKPQKKVIGGGTGFIVTSDGLIVTNRHVVSDTEAEYSVVLSNNKKYSAKVLAADAILDVALIKIEAKNLPVARLGNSDSVRLGQTVIAIGNSLSEYPNTITKGIISGRNRRVVAGSGSGSEVIEEALQTDAAINPGNSGGPLLNLSGEVIGINSAVNRAGEAIGFAIPINSVKKIITSVKQFGRIVRPWLGVRYVLINEEMAKANNLTVNYGALIVKGQNKTDLAVVPGSPADKAGLVENNIILTVNGVKIDESHSLATVVGKYSPGDIINLKILDKGEEKIIQVKLEEYKEK